MGCSDLIALKDTMYCDIWPFMTRRPRGDSSQPALYKFFPSVMEGLSQPVVYKFIQGKARDIWGYQYPLAQMFDGKIYITQLQRSPPELDESWMVKYHNTLYPLALSDRYTSSATGCFHLAKIRLFVKNLMCSKYEWNRATRRKLWTTKRSQTVTYTLRYIN